MCCCRVFCRFHWDIYRHLFYTMSEISSVVVTEVTNSNIHDVWPRILAEVKDASYIAIDAEMSGLGNKSGTMHPNIDDRYASLCQGAHTHSVISLGVTCFRFTSNCVNISDNAIKCTVSVYNFVLLCDEPYTIDPSAVKFLIQHGFNFNKQFASGLPYKKGNDKPNFQAEDPSIRSFLAELIRFRKPLVLHNGFADLIFLYQCFYADCPSKLSAFMADLSEMFPGGIYDTKYITEFCDHAPASYLLYAYKTACIKNSKHISSNRTFLQVQFTDNGSHSIAISVSGSTGNLENQLKDSDNADVCLKYAAYGWCLNGTSCPKSHDTDKIIQFHQSKSTSRKRKRKGKSGEEIDEPPSKTGEAGKSNSLPASSPSTKNISQAHRSGTDSFMTGYIFAVFISSRAKSSELNGEGTTSQTSGTDEYSSVIPFLDKTLQKSVKNKLYLSGKSIPLQVCKSSFTKTSKNHTEKLIRVYLSK